MNANLQPGTPGYEAMQIVKQPVPVADRRAALEDLLKRCPGDPTVTTFLEGLNVEESWTKARTNS